MANTIGNPLSWTGSALGGVASHVSQAAGRVRSHGDMTVPQVRKLDLADLSRALLRGVDDFKAMRSDVLFLCLLYPVIGAMLAWVAFNAEMLPLLFPMVTGFALIGPVAALGLYEMSRKREATGHANWGDALAVIKSPALGPILVLTAYLMAVFVAWILVAYKLHAMTMGSGGPQTAVAFVTEIMTTPAGYTMMAIGFPTGFLFALLVLVVSVVTVPMLLHRDVGLPVAVMASLRLTRKNPMVICAWGMIVTISLLLGAIPMFLGLIVVMPILGHASWHLYRLGVTQPPDAHR